ncbi:hypothetical protein Tco_1114198 [Tanacetum coccineum]|uniref:Uncharacterized protein n=1 Tax=Tanacetum coccineum TaxID=301880 RepID=A0ABQ5IVV6_9ASTR
MSNISDKGTTFGDGAARVGMQLRSSPKVSTSSPLVSPSTIINVPRELYSIDVAATFGVLLTIVGDLQKLINDIDAGKHDELLSELTNEDRMETLEALGSKCNSIKVDRNNVESVDINKSTSYAGVAGGSAKDQPNVNSNFHTLVADPVFDGVNIFIPRKVVEKVWICQISQEISQKRTRERMSDQEAKDLKAEAREIMPQPSTVNCKKPHSDKPPTPLFYKHEG